MTSDMDMDEHSLEFQTSPQAAPTLRPGLSPTPPPLFLLIKLNPALTPNVVELWDSEAHSKRRAEAGGQIFDLQTVVCWAELILHPYRHPQHQGWTLRPPSHQAGAVPSELQLQFTGPLLEIQISKLLRSPCLTLNSSPPFRAVGNSVAKAAYAERIEYRDLDLNAAVELVNG
ncbi:hypothetical protein STEG23_032428, partial [Scotinomys teguina]